MYSLGPILRIRKGCWEVRMLSLKEVVGDSQVSLRTQKRPCSWQARAEQDGVCLLSDLTIP